MFTGGLTIYGDPGTSPRSNAGWISLGPRRVRVPPRSTARVHYRITVPETLSLRGTYWSIIMVEPVTSAGSQLVPDETGRNLLGVETVVRYGIQIVTDIGDAGNRQIRFLGKRLIEVGDTRMLEIDIENVGEWWLSPDFYLEIYDESGRRSHRFEGGRKRIYPGCSVTHQVDLTDVPAGSYTALAILDNREEDVFGAQYNLWIDR
jgi:hypothetical protein